MTDSERLYRQIRAELDAAKRGSADDIRAAGWSVAVHNDYRVNGLLYTFWLFTQDGRAIKGEGSTDAEALDVVRRILDEVNKKLESAALTSENVTLKAELDAAKARIAELEHQIDRANWGTQWDD